MTRRVIPGFGPETSGALIELMQAVLEMQGFRLMPVRATQMVRGVPRLRVAWKKADGGLVQTVRVTISKPSTRK